MFEALGSRVMTGVVSLAMLLFSSFEGNDPKMTNLRYRNSDSFLYVSGVLENAFDNDFSTIFASGTPISVIYEMDVRQGTMALAKNTFRHTVSYNPATGIYDLKKDGRGEIYHSESVQDILSQLSHFEFGIPYQSSWKKVQIRIEARLPKVHFNTANKEVDLMLLWKYKKPSAKINADLRKPE